MIRSAFLVSVVLLILPLSSLADGLPASVEELWADFDPRKDALETEVIREWNENGCTYRYVRFLIGVFRDRPARMAAIYGFPTNATGRVPGVMHIHGGGQRASLDEVQRLAQRGYAALSLNWGGAAGKQHATNAPQGAGAGEPNTDWGAVDPTQLNVSHYSSMLPGPKQFFTDREHPKNCNWYLLTLGCRRGLTFLERQPEVDPERLGVHGFSMGGNLTIYVAGSDRRVKAAVSAVGGQGWRWEEHEFLGGKASPQETVSGNLDVFRRTLSFESYAPRIRCPLLHRSATNDFHGWIDDVYRTDALVRGQPVRHAWSPHFNHRLTPEVAVTMPLWFDQYLRGGPALPETPASRLTLKTDDGVPELSVQPQADGEVSRCEIYYSVDPDPRARFWRSAEVKRSGKCYVAQLPMHCVDLPLFAFANVYYALPTPEPMGAGAGGGRSIREFCLSSDLHSASAKELAARGVRATDRPADVLDDFSNGWRDWYRLNTDHPGLWQNWTRKVTDPKWRGSEGMRLALTLQLSENNRIAFVAIENEWRSYRGPRRTFVCEKEIPGAAQEQTVVLDVADFKNTVDGSSLVSWSELDQLGICAHYSERGGGTSSTRWRGPAPTFARLAWQGR